MSHCEAQARQLAHQVMATNFENAIIVGVTDKQDLHRVILQRRVAIRHGRAIAQLRCSYVRQWIG